MSVNGSLATPPPPRPGSQTSAKEDKRPLVSFLGLRVSGETLQVPGRVTGSSHTTKPPICPHGGTKHFHPHHSEILVDAQTVTPQRPSNAQSSMTSSSQGDVQNEALRKPNLHLVQSRIK